MADREIKCPKCGAVFQVDEASYAQIVKQVRDDEFARDLTEREKSFEREKLAAVELAKVDTEKTLQSELSQRENQIIKLEAQIDNIKAQTDTELASLKTQLENTKSQSQAELANLKTQTQIELDNAKTKFQLKLANEESKQQNLRDGYETQLKMRDEQIERLKDMKLKLSTKMVGESLEQFCQNEFNKIRATAFPQAYFDKDNTVSATSGSKGDFIFRDPAEGVESLSIMFEMKNENETTRTKKKNEDFFAELDKDRREKNCEYAILVSMLESESDLYNQGIVDVSYKYPKMYVIRPQFFVPMITILKNAAKKSLEAKQELALVKNQNIDITTFEDDVENWKSGWLSTMQKAGKKHLEAIGQINKAIKDLEKVRDALTLSDKHLLAAENKMDDLTVKRLTRKNPTMRAKFEELAEGKTTKES